MKKKMNSKENVYNVVSKNAMNKLKGGRKRPGRKKFGAITLKKSK